jgi:hypothetical protein
MAIKRSLIAPTALAAVAVFAACTVTAVQAQTTPPTPPLQAKLTVRALTPGEISAYKLPSTTQSSNGLYTVGLGEPLYLEVQVNSALPASAITGVTWNLLYKPAGSKASLVDSPLPLNIPVYEPSDRLVAQPAARKLLRPDVEGAYIVDATVVTSDGNFTYLEQMFLGAKYVGINTCALCHNGVLPEDTVTPWSKTGHATWFQQGVNGVLGSYSPSCVSCHTVGYDANNNVANGGFSAIAKALNWMFPPALQPGNFETMANALKNVSNIQCENCHGAGSMHAYGAFDLGPNFNMTTNAGLCGKCHDAPTHHIKTAEWNNSVHAVATRDPSGPGRDSCVGCHTGNGFIGRTSGAAKLDTTYSAITCATCHEPHGATVPDTNQHLVRSLQPVKLADGTVVSNAGIGLLCMNCHQSRQNAAQYAATAAASSHFGAHHGTQADMLEGVNGFTYGKQIPSSKHASEVEDTCVTCHMQNVTDTKSPMFLKAGGHTFKPAWEGDSTHAAVDLVGACQKCHGDSLTSFDMPFKDYDGDGRIDGVQTEVQHLLDKLSAMLPPAGQPKTSLSIDSTWSRAQLEAAYNWQFVHDDSSKGIHNAEYAAGLLKASIDDLSSKK